MGDKLLYTKQVSQGTREQLGITGKLIKMPFKRLVLHIPTSEVFSYDFVDGKAIFTHHSTFFKS